MPFVAYDLSLDLIRALRAPLALVRARNAELAKQLDDAADSVHQNLAEAGGRHGADRVRLFRYSYGSLREVRASLALAVAKGWLDGSEPAHAIAFRLAGCCTGSRSCEAGRATGPVHGDGDGDG